LFGQKLNFFVLKLNFLVQKINFSPQKLNLLVQKLNFSVKKTLFFAQKYNFSVPSLVPALLGSGRSSSALSGGWAPTSPPFSTLSGGGGRNSRNQLTFPWDFVRTSVKGYLSKPCHQACPGMVNLLLRKGMGSTSRTHGAPGASEPVAKNGFGHFRVALTLGGEDQ